jgi:superfamily II DNA or RNA helicase
MECLVDINTDEISPKDVTMVFANTKDKKEQKELVNVFKESLGTQYEVVLINGDETSNRKAEEKTKKIVSKAKRDGKKVVLISKDMGSRSYSIPEIDTVILMFDRGSYATISQKISRVLTPGKTYHNEEKKEGYIISLSLDPNREDFNPVDEYFVYEGEKVDSNELSEGIKKVLRSMNILVNDNGELTNIELDKYSYNLINSSSLIRLGKSSTNPDNIMVDGDLITLLTGIEIHKGNKESDNHLDGIDSSKVNRYKGDDKEKSKKEKEEKKKVENVRDKIRKHIENIVDNIVEISEINNCESDDIIECLNMIKEKGYDEEIVFEVDIDVDIVKKIILMGGVSHKLLNTIIASYNKEENSLLVK